MNALTRELQPYAGAVPDYRESLLRALDEERDRLDRLKRWAEQGIRHLDELRGEY
ncbi:sporulation phosphorelay system protein KapB [Acinetobacter baumannii]